MFASIIEKWPPNLWLYPNWNQFSYFNIYFLNCSHNFLLIKSVDQLLWEMFVLLNNVWTVREWLYLSLCLVIIAFSYWALSNRICLHMISSHMMTWDTFGSCQWYCPCCLEKNYVLLAAIPTVVFFWNYGKTTKINVNAVGLHLRRTSSNRNNVKLVQVIATAQLKATEFSPSSCETVQCILFIKQKSRYHKSAGCSYCKLNHIGSLSALASWTEFED